MTFETVSLVPSLLLAWHTYSAESNNSELVIPKIEREVCNDRKLSVVMETRPSEIKTLLVESSRFLRYHVIVGAVNPVAIHSSSTYRDMMVLMVGFGLESKNGVSESVCERDNQMTVIYVGSHDQYEAWIKPGRDYDQHARHCINNLDRYDMMYASNIFSPTTLSSTDAVWSKSSPLPPPSIAVQVKFTDLWSN